MTDKDLDRLDFSGSKGGKGGGEAAGGTESPNNLFNSSIARLIDVLCEGEIEGLVDGDKSIFLNETQLQSDTGVYNFDGVTTETREGTPSQNPLDGFPDGAPSATNVNAQLTYNNPISRTITDTDTDRIQVIVYVPGLQYVDSTTGDINPTSVTIRVQCNDVIVGNIVISGKTTNTYQRTYAIDNLSAYGSAPYTIKLTRLTADSNSTYLSNDTYWLSYNEIIDAKFRYPDTAYVGLTVDSDKFGTSIPKRLYEIDGMKIKVPSNRNGTTRTYTGTWDGTFQTEWSDNPAWILYDLLTNARYGLGLDEAKVDKAALYTIGAYCDEDVPYYDATVSGEEPRYRFNGLIQKQDDAMKAIEAVAQCARISAYWAGGLITFFQDSPCDPTRLYTDANVKDGLFTYEGSALSQRHTVAMVAWNDPDDFYYPAIEVVEDRDAIANYGWREKRINAIGCTSRSQAQRMGKWLLDSEQTGTELVKFVGGWDSADVMPGEVINVADPHYTTKRWGGRISSATQSSITMDAEITFVGGNTYTLEAFTPSGVLMSRTVTNPGTTTDTISVTSNFDETPQVHSVFMITSDDVEEPREFRVLQNKEVDKHEYEITGLLHDPNKYARIEQGIYFDGPYYSNIPAGELTPPTGLQGEEFTYVEGGLKNQKFGVKLSWIHSSDVRTEYYDVEKATLSGTYYPLGVTSTNYFEDKPVEAGTYWYRIRGVSAAAKSNYVTLDNFVVYSTTSGLRDVTGLQVVGGGYVFGGQDCEIEWDELISTASGVLKDYKVMVRKGDDDTLLRTAYPTRAYYKYDYRMNQDDNGGTAIRNPKFQVWGRDVYDGLSQNPATHVMTNPAPDMSGSTPTIDEIFQGLKIDWTNVTPSDNDLWKYKVYCDENNPPTTEIAMVGTDTTVWVEPGLSSSGTYSVQIEPYDKFGVGTKSNVSTGNEPLTLNIVDIPEELRGSIVMSDSDNNTTTTLAKLYDRNKTSDGVSYTISGTDTWIEYNFGITNFIDRISVWTSASGNAYVAYQKEEEGWNYLKADADHATSSGNELIDASSQSDARTNYWALEAGKNVAIFPQRIIADECRLYLTTSGNAATIYELVFMREVIAEQVTADNLSSISANIGTITAGIIQSNELSTTEGFLLDLDTNDMKIGGTIDPKFYWDNSEDTLYIDGTVNAGRRIIVEEGGDIVVGNHNIVLESSNDSLYVAPDGGKDSNDYIELRDGELYTYYYNTTTSAHDLYKSLIRIESGTASNETRVTIPGIFQEQPNIFVTPHEIQTYNKDYSAQSQTISIDAYDIDQTVSGSTTWQFTPRARLQLSDGSYGAVIYDTKTRNVSTYNSYADLTGVTVNPVANTRSITVTMQCQAYSAPVGSYDDDPGEEVDLKWYRQYHAAHYYARLYYKVNGSWLNKYQYVAGNYNNYSKITTVVLDTGTQAFDITDFYCYLDIYGQTSGYYYVDGYESHPGSITYEKLVSVSYTSDQTSAAVVASGTLSWIAIGR